MYRTSTKGYSATASVGIGKLNAVHFKPITEKINEIVEYIPFPENSKIFTIGDYGTADGVSSMYFMRELILKLKQYHGHKVDIQIVYEDQEINDFNSLFRCLAALGPDSPSFLPELDNVYPLASGINFTKQCVPSNSMHLIISMLSAQWLSSIPVLYKQSLYIYPESTPEEKEALYDQAKHDWENFLLMRSRELKQGGLLVVTTPSEKWNGKKIVSGHNLILALTEIWVSFRKSGRITNDEFINTNFPFWAFSLKELRAPFGDPNSSVTQSGLILLSADVYTNEFPFFGEWRNKKDIEGIDDRETFAKEYVKSQRSWCNNTFLGGLSDSRSPQERQAIVDQLFQIAEERLSTINPESIHNDCFFNYLYIQKSKSSLQQQ